MPSEGLKLQLTKDDITPAMKKALAVAKDGSKAMRAAGTQIVSIAKQSFRDPAQRGAAWPAKKGGQPSNLILKGVLSKSVRITGLTKDTVTVGSDRKYAAIHQLGGVIKAKPGKALVFTIGGKKIVVKAVTMPARPYLPFTKAGKLIARAQEKVRKIIQKAVDQQLGIK